ncbi:unnamed protein product [Orchesella dallaii]|uniref:Peptidase S1 domain-containing protein n=1 Tax=Orchesella dallaii TaxID=48710 RepID=A0ABP1RF12_9HEXA
MRATGNFLLVLLPISYLSQVETSRISTSNTAIQPRIVGGREAREGEFAYQVQILYNQKFICSGSLVVLNGTQMIVTAAHCVANDDNPEKYQLVAGNLDTSYKSEHEQRVNVSKIVIHPKYISPPPVNDIAVMFVNQSYKFNISRYVAPISLPRQYEPTIGSVIISGWGNLGPFLGAPDTLHKVVVETIPDFVCTFILIKYGIRPPSSTLCTSVGLFGGRGICAGDSGGPVTSINGRYLAGIVSYSPTNKCGAAFQPSVSTEVSYFVNWIEQLSKGF